MTLTIATDPSVTVGLWDVDANGNWSVAANWINNNIPNSRGSEALFGIGSALRTVTLDAPETIGVMAFTKRTHSWWRRALSALTLDNEHGGARVNVSAGSANAVQTPVSLNDNVTATARARVIPWLFRGTSSAPAARPRALAVTGAEHARAFRRQHLRPIVRRRRRSGDDHGNRIHTTQVGSSTALGAGDVDVVAKAAPFRRERR